MHHPYLSLMFGDFTKFDFTQTKVDETLIRKCCPGLRRDNCDFVLQYYSHRLSPFSRYEYLARPLNV
jgi:hypothetical protein